MSAVQPWSVGTQGVTNFTRGEIARRARNILESDDYEASLRARIASHTLPAAVEVMLWHYAYGKPAETVNLQVQDGQEDLSSLSTGALRQRLAVLSQVLEEVEATENAIPAEVLAGPWPMPASTASSADSMATTQPLETTK